MSLSCGRLNSRVNVVVSFALKSSARAKRLVIVCWICEKDNLCKRVPFLSVAFNWNDLKFTVKQTAIDRSAN